MVVLFTVVLGLLCLAPSSALSQEFNYDETKVPQYELPSLLVNPDGQPVTEAKTWLASTRSHWKQTLTEEVYGQAPSATATLTIHDESVKLIGAVKCKQVTLRLTRNEKSIDLQLLVFLPADAKTPVKTFLGLNFQGNHTVTSDEGIRLPQSWLPNSEKKGIRNHQASETSRGVASSRWPIAEITARGYGIATMYYGDIDPDFHDGFGNGIHALFSDIPRDQTSWGSISGWARGISRIMDYFEQDADIDETRICLMGHSRLGKTSLWAGACDERFAVVISNNSGCGGAALSRRRFGETVQRINTSFPHWFCENYARYNENEDACPVDQHTLISLIAPRPVLICSAENDRWADPKGEFLSAKHADSVYRLLGTDGIAADRWPAVNRAVMSRIGYHMRPGGHGVKLQDWQIYMDFADKHLP